jgi:phosphatidylserine decarboxylase
MTAESGGFARRVARVIPIAAEGVTVSATVLAAGIVLFVAGLVWPGIVACLLGAAFVAFFRDPERSPAGASDGAVLSGADGRVSDIVEASLPEAAPGERYQRVSVFMSPLDVHVNRAPVGGEVLCVQHKSGVFRAAFRDLASEHNERNLIVLGDAHGRRHAIVQIAGYLARRIVCRLNPHDTVQRGERIGLIVFGSRVDHFLPLGYQVMVRVGDRVRAAESIIGELRQ